MTTRTIEEWESRFRTWAGGPGDTELARCENAERMIRKAIAGHAVLKTLNIDVFAQGSFRNITNIAQESDIDVSVCLLDAIYYTIPEGTTENDFGIGPTTQKYDGYKQNVVEALSDYFGNDTVTPGNKAIRIHSNSYRVDADVVPNFEYREYYNVNEPTLYRSGIRFYSDDGNVVTNYPKQHIEQGVEKNKETQKRFKRMARVLKSLQLEMNEEKVIVKKLPSFFIESLVYNVPKESFGSVNYRDDVRNILAHIFNNTRAIDKCEDSWFEVNGIKYLFHSTQSWSKSDAHAFADAAWNYLKFD